jgi:hypothetical protein
MTKCLLTVTNSVSVPHGLTSIFNAAWYRFIEEHKDQLLCDVEFAISGSPDPRYKQAIGSYPVTWRDSRRGNVGINAQLLYYEMFLSVEKRDYEVWIVLHSDTFPSVDSINNICRYFDDHPEANYVAPVNSKNMARIGKNPVVNDYFFGRTQPDGGYQLPEVEGCKPWGVPYPGSGLLAVRVSLLREATKIYAKLAKKGMVRQASEAWVSCSLRFNRICDLLGYTGKHSGLRDKLYSGGMFEYDFFTCMVLAGITPAVACNVDNRSFELMGFVLNNGEAMLGFDSVEDVRDKIDILPQCIEDTVVAPFLHLCDSSHCERLHDPNWFRSDTPTYYRRIVSAIGQPSNILYLTILRCLVRAGSQDFVKTLDNGILRMFQACQQGKGLEDPILVRHYEDKSFWICRNTLAPYCGDLSSIERIMERL